MPSGMGTRLHTPSMLEHTVAAEDEFCLGHSSATRNRRRNPNALK